MKVATTTTDNITEILNRIITFTELRREVLTRNLFDYRQEHFRPKDLPVGEFSMCMTEAVSEYLHSRRLLLCDKNNVYFGEEGAFEALATVDLEAEKLLTSDTRKYLKYQIHKLSENLMNNRIAEELLKKTQHPALI